MTEAAALDADFLHGDVLGRAKRCNGREQL
jgi:hypothetical protein